MKLRICILLTAFSLFAAGAKAQTSPRIGKVLPQLHLSMKDCYVSLIAEKVLPYDPGISVVVIPKTVDSSEGYFTLDSYILLVNNSTGKIISRYYESSKTNGWESDAMRLDKITIDTAPYTLKPATRAFGIRVVYTGSSRPNPYNTTTLSLFVQQGSKLQRVLNSYEVSSLHGEWDTNCAGEMTGEESTISVSGDAIDSYCDLEVNTKVTHAVTRLVAGDCKETSKTKFVRKVLRFYKGEYK